ncbi:hypothetical protein KIF53_09065 [Chromobacterium subtsugae]|uniref:Exo-alpha-sialidase n=1 Tax=Chromobacterium subtsugae TaxID=251747 RepID=A0ABS7FCH9_9NEIS|nr:MULTISPECIES: hypothetical protein [Chromobacterium]MBW7566367.1 hypothetical protein [Chromobacterium subtsugae]MBW8287774.1 hypothetical protein [Chromobacterium subtsugae]WSE91105.1 hypothetical protein U6115_19850 [Chromobacterium subtsugae]WVH59479.1 hypothetical protein U6151_19880 [Chromobacterium subtsugae]
MQTRLLASLLTLTLLSACTSTQLAGDPLNEKPDSQSGTVILSLTINTGEVPPIELIELTRNEDPTSGFNKKYQLKNIVPGLSKDTALYIGTLPAGTYKLDYLRAQLKFLSVSPGQRELVGDFRVEPGKTSDLGRLILTAINYKVAFGRSLHEKDNRKLVALAAPSYQSLYQQASSTGWLKTEPTDRIEAYALSRPQGAGGFSELADHRIIGGSRFGSILVRQDSGHWKLIGRTGELNSILFTTPYPIQPYMAVAVGEFGSFFKVRMDGKTLPIDRGNLPLGNYFFIDSSPDQKHWFVGVQLPGKVSLYESNQLENGNWKIARENPAGILWLWHYPGGIGYASSSVRVIACYDYAQKQWCQNDTPEKRYIIAVAGGPTKSVGVLTQVGLGIAGVFAKTHYSSDCGANWKETHSPYTVKASAPIILPSGQILESGGVFGDTGIYRSDDGSNWSKIYSDQLILRDHIWVMPTAGLISVSNSINGVEDIQYSNDGGATWSTEVTSYDSRQNNTKD